MSVFLSTKFLRLLQVLNPKELKDFETWLQSPWCNTNKNLIQLLARLKPYYPDFSDQNMSKEKLFRQVLPNGKYSERRMNNLFSEAYLVAEKFLVFQRVSRMQDLQNDLLSQEFQHRALDDWFFKDTSREIEHLTRKEVKSWEDEVELFRLYRSIYHHPSQESRMAPGGKLIRRMREQLDLLYLLEKATVINEMISRNRLFEGEQHDVAIELKKWVSISEGIEHPALDLYRMRFAHTGETQPVHYEQRYTAFLERFDLLNDREQNIHLLSLLNDAKLLIKSGSLDITASLPLYQLGLTTGAILNKGKLTDNTYMTIVIASNTKGTFDFTDHFMDTYAGCLTEKTRDDCTHWAKAHTAYWRKDLERSLAILQEYHFRVPDFQLISRVLHTQVYFDLYLQDYSYQASLFSFFDTFEKWLSREKLWSKFNKTSFLRFIQICRILARYYTDVSSDPKKLERLLEKEHNIQALNWLKQKKEVVLLLKTKY
ncbi:MAG: hypothetical protein HUU01_21765 [Saprospiraceae bacterium]|nr:hypothetical protein [Saprospiraceae bacterium]